MGNGYSYIVSPNDGTSEKLCATRVSASEGYLMNCDYSKFATGHFLCSPDDGNQELYIPLTKRLSI